MAYIYLIVLFWGSNEMILGWSLAGCLAYEKRSIRVISSRINSSIISFALLTDHLGFPHSSFVKNPPAVQETPVWFLGQEDPWRRDRLPTPVFLGFPYGSAGKESACNAGDLGSIPGLGRSPGEGKGYLPKHSGLEKSMDCLDHGVTKSRTERLSLHWIT